MLDGVYDIDGRLITPRRYQMQIFIHLAFPSLVQKDGCHLSQVRTVVTLLIPVDPQSPESDVRAALARVPCGMVSWVTSRHYLMITV